MADENNTNPPSGNPSKGGVNSDVKPAGSTTSGTPGSGMSGSTGSSAASGASSSTHSASSAMSSHSPAPGASSTAPAGQKSLAEEAQEAKADVKGEAHAAMTEAQSRAGGALDEAKGEAGKLAEQARRRAELAAGEYKNRAAEQGHSMADRLRAAGQEFGSGSLPDRYVGRMADSLSDAADAFSQKDLGSLIADTASFARRNPAAFVGGAMLLGFAAARFLKASNSERRYDYDYAMDDRASATRPGAPGATSYGGAGRPISTPAVHAPEK